MLIQCSSCSTQAKIPDSKEGAKVKCPSCGHIYIARSRERGGRARATQKSDPTKMFIIGGAVVAAIAIGLFAMKSSGKGDDEAVVNAAGDRNKSAEPVEKVAYVPPGSIDGPAATFVKNLYIAASSGDAAKVTKAMAAEPAYEAFRTARPPGSEPMAAWAELSEAEKVAAKESLVEKLLAQPPTGSVAGWEPFDLKFERKGERITLEMRSSLLDPEAPPADRWVTWTLLSEGEDQFKWVEAKGAYTKAEKKAIAIAEGRAPEIEAKPKTVVMSDGQKVRESVARPIAYDADVDDATRTKLDGLIAQIFAESGVTNKARRAAKEELLVAGKPAIAPLLTQLAKEAETDPNDGPRKRNLLQIESLLNEITGRDGTTLGLGSSPEQIESGIKQWFAWYDTKYARFTAPVKVDDAELDDPFITDEKDLTREERVQREFDRAKKKRDN